MQAHAYLHNKYQVETSPKIHAKTFWNITTRRNKNMIDNNDDDIDKSLSHLQSNISNIYPIIMTYSCSTEPIISPVKVSTNHMLKVLKNSLLPPKRPRKNGVDIHRFSYRQQIGNTGTNRNRESRNRNDLLSMYNNEILKLFSVQVQILREQWSQN